MNTTRVGTPFLLCLLTGLALGCSSSDDATTGKRVVFKSKIQPVATSFETTQGWTITLTKVQLGVESFHYFDGNPAVIAMRAPWYEGLFLRTAHAHPGHYQAGNAVGQMLTPASVDLLAGPTTLADGEGVTATGRSARMTLGNVAGNNPALAEGKAVSGQETRYFRLISTAEELQKSAGDGRIEGCVFGPANIDGDGTVTASVDLKAWFTFVDFAKLAPGTADAPTEPAATDVARVGFNLGVAQANVYTFSYSK